MTRSSGDTPSGRTEWYTRISEVFEEMRRAGKSSEAIFLELQGELKRLAHMRLAHAAAGPSMHASRLLSDLYFRLFVTRTGEALSWDSAGEFVGYIAKTMSTLLIDHARQFQRRGGRANISLDSEEGQGLELPAGDGEIRWTSLSPERVENAIFVDQILSHLEQDRSQGEKPRIAERQADIVRMRLFLGYTEAEAAAILGCSSETVTKEFRKAHLKLANYAREEKELPFS